MIIIINGSVGVGKSTISWGLLERFDRAVMLDGDHIGAVHPFEIYDRERIEYLYKTLVHLIKFHMSNGYDNFVINYVFEKPEELGKLIELLEETGQNTKGFLLTCADSEQERRILKRSTGQVDWELKRYRELNEILTEARKIGFIGEEINTTDKSIDQIVDEIWANL